MISVIICTHNPSEKYLNQTIESILAQKFPKQEIDFFIVDNNSDVSVAKINIVCANKIKVVEEKIPGLTAARECGMKNALGNIIVYVDDDNILALNYLFEVDKIFNQINSLGVLSGEIIPIYERKPPKWFYNFEPSIAVRRLPDYDLFLTRIPIFNQYFPIGAGMAVRKEIMVGYFNDLLNNKRIEGRIGKQLSSGEDIDVDLFAISHGFEIGTSKKLLLHHLIPKTRTTLSYIKKLNKANLRSTLQINDKWKDVFHIEIFNFLHASKLLLMAKILGSLLLFFLPKSRIRVSFYSLLLINKSK